MADSAGGEDGLGDLVGMGEDALAGAGHRDRRDAGAPGEGGAGQGSARSSPNW
jgi:hypothetical protein